MIMKWILTVFLGIFFAFLCLIGIGWTLPASQTLERNIDIDGYVEDIFPILNDLRTYTQWEFQSNHGDDLEIAFGGPESGVGQTAAWQTDDVPPRIGTQEIVESETLEFVRTQLNLNGVMSSQTYALSHEAGNETVNVLLRREQDLGGFPYLQRITVKFSEGRIKMRLDRSLNRLKTIVENQVEPSSPL